MKATLLFLNVLLLTPVLTSCVNFASVDGVDNAWREVPLDQFQEGVTTQSDVLAKLGPPSQLISLDKQVVFYYLAQQNTGKGQIFIVWNQMSEENLYDRAIFFFDQDGLLTDVAYSNESIAR